MHQRAATLTSADSLTSGSSWSAAHRVLFRFAFAYFLLYSFPFPIGLIPGTEWLTTKYEQFWSWLVPWVGKHLLLLTTEISVLPNGSGDTTFNYVQLLCFVIIAVVIAATWSALDRRRGYPTLHEWLRIYLRYVLAVSMLGYGMHKVIKLQFPAPGLARLMQPYGDSSPMGLLWTFMGYSTSYTFFAGIVEVIGGVLLFFRKTTTLGALLLVAVIGNIVVLNFSYDVPVKLYSSNLLLMAMVLVLPDLRRLMKLFILNRDVPAAIIRPLFQRRWLSVASVAFKVLFIGLICYSTVSGSLHARKQYGDAAARPPLYGLWDVEQFARDNETIPPDLSHRTRWRRLAYGKTGAITVRRMDDSLVRYLVEDDSANQTLKLATMQNPNTKHTLRYSRPDEEHLLIEGKLADEEISVSLRRVPESTFLLMNRGFHWINEYPFNR